MPDARTIPTLKLRQYANDLVQALGKKKEILVGLVDAEFFACPGGYMMIGWSPDLYFIIETNLAGDLIQSRLFNRHLSIEYTSA